MNPMEMIPVSIETAQFPEDPNSLNAMVQLRDQGKQLYERTVKAKIPAMHSSVLVDRERFVWNVSPVRALVERKAIESFLRVCIAGLGGEAIGAIEATGSMGIWTGVLVVRNRKFSPMVSVLGPSGWSDGYKPRPGELVDVWGDLTEPEREGARHLRDAAAVLRGRYLANERDPLDAATPGQAQVAQRVVRELGWKA